MPDFTTALGITVGDAAKKTNFDKLLDNTLCNGYRLKILHTITGPAAGWVMSTTGYVPIGPNLTVGDFWENGSRLVGANYLRWEISYLAAADSGGYVRLYNLTDAAAVANSEVNCPGSGAAWVSIQLPASSANYFSLVANEKKYQVQTHAQVGGKNFAVGMVRLLAVMPIV